MTYPTISDLGGEAHLIRRYAIPSNKSWSAFNPSIVLSNEGEYWIAFRASNYIFSDTRISVKLTTGNRVRNKMFIVRLNDDWSFDEETLKEITVTNVRDNIIRGLEDPRLFWDGTSYCISSTYLEKDNPIARISKIRIKSLEDPEVLSIEIYPSPNNQVEKNWMPVQDTESFIYDYCSVFTNGQVTQHSVNKKYETFRGGTQVIPLGDGTSIGLIHEIYSVVVRAVNPTTFSSTTNVRNYSHKFVRYNKDLKPIQCSEDFIFVKKGIEFASGIAPTKDGFVISLGRSDLASYVSTISKENVLATLKDLDV